MSDCAACRVSACGRITTAPGSATSSATSGPRALGAGTAPATSRIGIPSSRRAQVVSQRSDAASPQCRSSTARSSGWRVARFAASQKRPCSVENGVVGEDVRVAQPALVEERRRERGGAGEQLLALVGRRECEDRLEELPDDAERELVLALAAARADAQAGSGTERARPRRAASSPMPALPSIATKRPLPLRATSIIARIAASSASRSRSTEAPGAVGIPERVASGGKTSGSPAPRAGRAARAGRGRPAGSPPRSRSETSRGRSCSTRRAVVLESRIWPPWPASPIREAWWTANPTYPSSPTVASPVWTPMRIRRPPARPA